MAQVADTPEKIARFRLLALYGRLKLEVRGLRFKRGTMTTAQAVREELEKNGRRAPRNKVELLEEYRKYLVEEYEMTDGPSS